jgi:hypothetical protein
VRGLEGLSRKRCSSSSPLCPTCSSPGVYGSYAARFVGQFGLMDWDDACAAGDWPVLLAGNGASRAVSARFAYDSLFDAADLGADDRALFAELATTNFEEVLKALDFASLLHQQLGLDPAVVEARREAVRQALVATVNHHHVAWTDVEGDRLTAIHAALRQHEVVFSTSYDLLIYWAMNHGGPDEFIDHFWHLPGHHFDADDSPVWGNRTVVNWIHGALQLYRLGSDGTAKRVNVAGAALLAQFAHRGVLPLYVAEGTAEQKRLAIGSSDYLSYCLDALESEARDIVIFGQALGPSDQHLVEAIRLHPGRRVACSVFPGSQLQADADKARIAQQLQRDDIFYFDSTTHPLGLPSLAVVDASAP